MRFFMISCKKASYLVSKKEENRLSWWGSWQLRAHLGICSFCRKFEQQSGFIGRMAKQVTLHETLSPETKEKIQAALTSEN